MRVAEIVKDARERRLWSRERLAEHANLDVRTIRRVESGEPVFVETLYRVDRALGGELSRLLGVAP